MTQISKEEYLKNLFQQVDPRPDIKRRDDLEFKKFLFAWIPLGAILAIFGCIVMQSGGPFIPLWVFSTFLLTAVSAGMREDQ